MDYRGLSVIGVWVSTLGISALFLMFDFTTDFIMALILATILLTVYIVRLKPGGAEEIEKFANQLGRLSGRLSAIEGKVDEINKLLEE